MAISEDQLREYDSLIKAYIDSKIDSKLENFQNSILSNSTLPIVNSISPTTIVVEEDIQEDYIVYDRVITPNENIEYKNIVVTNDDRSNRIYFNMWFTFDNIELADKTISIVWINANNESGISQAVDVELKSENRLTFAWNVPAEATYKAGIIQYAIRITDTNYIWNSLPSSIECVKGLVTEEFNNLEEAELNPGWLEFIETKYKANIEIKTAAEYEAISQPSMTTLYVVTGNNNAVSLYLGTKAIISN